jgi:sigma-B regulation protein RsbU (phosphoserine phosphatase)
MRFANAGHPKPLHVGRSAGKVEMLAQADRRSGAALGVFDDVRYDTHTARIEPGDLVVLFTDGLYEVEGPNGEYFDQTRLISAVRARLQTPTEQLFEELLSEVQEYAASHRFIDDVCLVGVELRRLMNDAERKVGETPQAIG